MSDEAVSQVQNARALACRSCRQRGWLPVVIALSVTSGFCVKNVDAAEPLPSFEHRELWEPLSGTWVFEDNDTVRQTATADDRNTAFLLKWKGELPKAYHLSVQIEREDLIKEALSEAYFQKQVDNARTFLRLCEENDLKAFLGLHRWWVTRGEWDHIERFVAALMGEPGLLAWYTYDEPNWVGLSPALMTETARRIRNIDPHHPVKLYLNNRWEITDYIRGMDIVATHMGPQLPIAINEWVRMAPHATSLTGRPHPPAIWDGDRFGKTPPELVWSAKYVQLIGDVRGWTDYYRPFIHANHPETWAAMCEANGMLKQVMPLFLREGEELAVPSSRPIRIDTKVHTDTDSARIDKDDADSAFMARACKGRDGNVVLAVFNYGSRKGTWSWDVAKDIAPAHVETLAGSGNCDMQDGQLCLTLKPFTGTVIQLRVK